MSGPGDARRVAVVGGGLAGLAAAAALSDGATAQGGLRVTLFEARQRLGGRATSFRDPASGELVDHCQHVSMGCCTNFADFCRRAGIGGLLRSDRRLHFIGPGGERATLQASGWLPAPLHLAPSLWRQKYLTAGERLSVARAMWRLIRTRCSDAAAEPAIGQWLAAHGQTARMVERFWSVVLTSALGETPQHASLAHARKVFVDGFLAAREACRVDVPRVPLAEFYGRIQDWLTSRGADVRLGSRIKQIGGEESAARWIELADGSRQEADGVVLAVPWWQAAGLVASPMLKRLPQLAKVAGFQPSPITGVHLWFDRPIMELPHAVLIGRLSQWVFNRGTAVSEGSAGTEGDAKPSHYYQVVISASRELARRPREDIVCQVVEELTSAWPAAGEARLKHWRVVTDPKAVFSVRPGLDGDRPAQQTAIGNLVLAGDWTRTGWPATMESAVRSGYLAAEALLRQLGSPRTFVVRDLPRGLFARLLIG